MEHVFVTGAAGFIGSTLVERLLTEGCRVTGWDNLSTGRMEFLASALASPHFALVLGDNLELSALESAMRSCDFVFHLAANADVRRGPEHPERDLQQNTVATFQVLEAMRRNGIRQLAFSSTGAIYGDSPVVPTPEDAPFPVQTSLYGASKLAGEGLISAYCASFGMQASIFRFVSILGERYTHGHVFDFYRQLRANSARLHILGDGRQRKSYLDVSDCVEALWRVCSVQKDRDSGLEIYNLGTDSACELRDSVAWICQALGLKAQVSYSGGLRGWVGDNPYLLLDTRKIRRTGWTPRFTIQEGVYRTLGWLQANEWVFQPPTPMGVCG